VFEVGNKTVYYATGFVFYKESSGIFIILFKIIIMNYNPSIYNN
jgi:hypothetical protein